MRIYTPDGRIVKRIVGFCDYSYSVVKEERGNDSLVDLIGNEIDCGETEEEFLDQQKERGDL